VLNLPPDDGMTRWMWYWHFGDSGIFVRLLKTWDMQKFDALRDTWLPMDGNYLRRAAEDPSFEEVVPLTDFA